MDLDRSTAVCFTGHRSIPAMQYEEVSNAVLGRISEMYARGYRTFIAGGAVGFDMLAAQAASSFRQSHPDAKLVLALPFKGHDTRFSVSDKRLLALLCKLADDVVTVSERYFPGVYAARNRWMVDHSRACICYLRQYGRSGTAQTLAMAKGAKLEIVEV